jgi:hypothetical protein
MKGIDTNRISSESHGASQKKEGQREEQPGKAESVFYGHD